MKKAEKRNVRLELAVKIMGSEKPLSNLQREMVSGICKKDKVVGTILKVYGVNEK